MTLDKGFKLAITQDGRSQKCRLRRWDRRPLCKSVLLEDQNENAWAWPDTFGLGCCLAPEPTTPATPGVRFVSKGKRQRVPEDDRESGR